MDNGGKRATNETRFGGREIPGIPEIESLCCLLRLSTKKMVASKYTHMHAHVLLLLCCLMFQRENRRILLTGCSYSRAF